MSNHNKLIRLVSASVLMGALFATQTASAQYYVVYAPAYAVACDNCAPRQSCCHHRSHHHRAHHTHHRTHHVTHYQRNSYRIEVFYPVAFYPCSTEYMACSPCGGCDDGFSNYPSRTVYYNSDDYDESQDMRTGDDTESDLQIN